MAGGVSFTSRCLINVDLRFWKASEIISGNVSRAEGVFVRVLRESNHRSWMRGGDDTLLWRFFFYSSGATKPSGLIVFWLPQWTAVLLCAASNLIMDQCDWRFFCELNKCNNFCFTVLNYLENANSLLNTACFFRWAVRQNRCVTVAMLWNRRKNVTFFIADVKTQL